MTFLPPLRNACSALQFILMLVIASVECSQAETSSGACDSDKTDRTFNGNEATETLLLQLDMSFSERRRENIPAETRPLMNASLLENRLQRDTGAFHMATSFNQSDEVADLDETLPARKPVMYIHIHKSAGSLICEEAVENGERIVQPSRYCGSNNFHDTEVPGNNMWNEGDYGYIETPDFDSRATTCADRVSMFGDKFTWTSIERQLDSGDLCFESFVYFTVFRETLDRMTSQVNYKNKVDEPPFPYKDLIPCLVDALAVQGRNTHCPLSGPLGEILSRTRGFVFLDNFVVRTLGGSDTMMLPPGGVNASHLSTAIALLDRFDLVIPSEELDSKRAGAALDRVIGWHPHQDATARVTEHVVNFTKQEVESLRSINLFDIALYDHAVEKYKSGANR